MVLLWHSHYYNIFSLLEDSRFRFELLKGIRIHEIVYCKASRNSMRLQLIWNLLKLSSPVHIFSPHRTFSVGLVYPLSSHWIIFHPKFDDWGWRIMRKWDYKFLLAQTLTCQLELYPINFFPKAISYCWQSKCISQWHMTQLTWNFRGSSKGG